MKILIIDSHKGTENETPTNLHWTNAKQIADYLGGEIIWTYPSVNDAVGAGYDKIIFVHASPYCNVDKAWLEKSPNADLFYVTNEYNLGEPRILWKPAKHGRHYTVIANHDPQISKVVKKYVKDWHKINLNALIYKPVPFSCCDDDLQISDRGGVVYYGSYRKGRESSFRKYLDGRPAVSTHSRNIDKFKYIGVPGMFIPRLNWKTRGTRSFMASLYLEDDVTHDSYNFLANRFYEALNYHTPTVFSSECQNTIDKSGYRVPKNLIVDDPAELKNPDLSMVPGEWNYMAAKEKGQTLKQIKDIVYGLV